jgi:crossover junction endodeoxyribonuclease RuvC
MEYYHIGLDLSLTGTGFTILDANGDRLHEQLISTTNKDVIEDRIMNISDIVVNSIYLKYSNCSIFMEGLSYASSGQSTLELAALHYYVRCKFKTLLLNYSVVPPTVLKKFVTGKGQCKKELMLLKTYKKYNIEFEDNNLCDSFCLAKYSHTVKNSTTSLNN